jgi:GGDEF domain-containing protein
MKTLKISDDIHRKLTARLGTLMAQTGKMQTYQDAIQAMLNRSVIPPTALLAEIENFIEENKRLGYTTREEFIRDAARWRLKFLREESEYVEIPRDKYERLEAAVKEMSTPYHSAPDFCPQTN